MGIFDRVFGKKTHTGAGPEKTAATDSVLTDALLAAAAANSIDLKPGDIVVRTTGAQGMMPGIGGLLGVLTNEEQHDLLTLDVLVLFDPSTRTSILWTDDPEGRGRGLKAILGDTSKRFILRIEKANLEFLQADSEIWRRVTQVVEE